MWVESQMLYLVLFPLESIALLVIMTLAGYLRLLAIVFVKLIGYFRWFFEFPRHCTLIDGLIIIQFLKHMTT